MKTSPTGGDSPAAILVQDLRAWAKYQPFSFTGRHPANLESGITCGERAGQGNVVGDCWPLPSTPLAPNPERSPHQPLGNLPGITRTGLSPGTLQRGGENGPARAALCTGSNSSRAGGSLSSSEQPAAWRVQGPTETAATRSSCTGCAREGKAFCSATSPPAKPGRDWPPGKDKVGEIRCWEGMPGAGSRVVLCHLALIGQIPKWPEGTSERSVQAREMAQGQTVQHLNTKHKTTHYRERGQPSDCRSVPCLHRRG